MLNIFLSVSFIKNVFLLLTGFFLVSCLASCMPDPLEVKDIPVVEPKIVVSTQLLPGEPVVVWLTQNIGALDASEESDPEEILKKIAVNDAWVTIAGPESTYTLNHLGDGLYGDVIIPFDEGKQYELRVRSESFGEVYATTTVQPRVEFEEVTANLFFDIYDDTLARVTYSIKDPPQKNRYVMNAWKLTGEDIIGNVINPVTFTQLLDDTPFNGNLYEHQIDFSPNKYAPGDTIAVSLSNISEEYYNFLELRVDKRLDFVEFLSEPQNYPSNVVGGRGFFNLYLPDIRLFVFEQDE